MLGRQAGVSWRRAGSALACPIRSRPAIRCAAKQQQQQQQNPAALEDYQHVVDVEQVGQVDVDTLAQCGAQPMIPRGTCSDDGVTSARCNGPFAAAVIVLVSPSAVHNPSGQLVVTATCGCHSNCVDLYCWSLHTCYSGSAFQCQAPCCRHHCSLLAMACQQ